MSKVQIFHTNDIHSQYNNLAKIASYLKSHRKQNSLLLDAGDFIDFSCKENYISQGKYGLSLLESCKYDAISIGNNEGFNSISIVEKLAKKSKVKFLSVNLKKKNHQDLKYIQSSFLITCNQIRFLIIGATPFAPSYNDYFHLYGFHSEEPYALIKNEIEKHQNQYDCVILLSHLGYRNDKILANSDLPIHLIIGGHSHTLLPLEKINKTYIHQVGVNGTYLGQIEVELKDKQLCIQAKEISMKNYHYHKDLLNEIQLQSLSLQSKLNQKLLHPSLGLKTSIYQENSLTNFLADCMLNEKKADFALINSGMASTHIHKGSFTYQDLLNVNNSPILLIKTKIAGKDIIDAINLSFNKNVNQLDGHGPGFRGKFLGKLHVSSNVIIYYKNQMVTSIYIDNQLIQPNKIYNVITTDYLKRVKYYPSLNHSFKDKYYKINIRDLLLKYLSIEEFYFQAQIKRYRKEPSK